VAGTYLTDVYCKLDYLKAAAVSSSDIYLFIYITYIIQLAQFVKALTVNTKTVVFLLELSPNILSKILIGEALVVWWHLNFD